VIPEDARDPREGSAEKHGNLFGGALTDEALLSSRSVLQSARGGSGTKGLQQWFTPEPVARFIADVVGRSVGSVLDPTAGAGSLLAPFEPEARFGVEIDRDHARAARKAEERRRKARLVPEDGPLHGASHGEPDRLVGYDAISGDAQRVVPILRAAGAEFDAVVVNPPFGLRWRDQAHSPKGSEINSTVLAFLWAMDLMGPEGQGAMVCGRDRLAKEVLGRPEAEGIYAIVEIEGRLFDGVSLPCAISFFHKPENTSPYAPSEPLRLSSPREDLHLLSGRLRRARYEHASYVATCAGPSPRPQWRAARAEHEARAAEEAGERARQDFDVYVMGSRIRARPSAYALLALAKEKRDREVQLLDGQSVAYFAQNTRAYRGLLELEANGTLRLEPALKAAAEKAVREGRLLSTPLSPVKPQQRLGWLEDLDRIRCKRGCPEKGFVSGTEYPLFTRSKVSSTTEERIVEHHKTGEPELRHFTLERRLLEVSIGNHTFDEGAESIRYLTEHFELPDPGCVATLFPDKVARNLRVLEEIEERVRENYDRYMRGRGERFFDPFSYKPFQKDHYSRLLTKGRGLLAHEQGCGKTLGQMTLAEATRVIHGAKDQALFVAPQDLRLQWAREGRKFFGRSFEVIRNPADAHAVARRMKRGESGWFFTWFEALSLVGRKKTPLPAVYKDHLAALNDRLTDYKLQKRSREHGDALGKDQIAAPGTVPLYPIVDAIRGLNAPPPRTTSAHACPECGANAESGWNGEVCSAKRAAHPDYAPGGVHPKAKGCGYVHRKLHVRPAASHLSSAFKRGVRIVDEVTEIRGDDSLRSKAVRAIARGPHPYGGTGTPLSNFINDTFWPMWWCLGNANPSFPYDYANGKAKYENDFAVVEYAMGREEDGEQNVKKRRKVLPRITNVSQFWRLTAPSVSRVRMEDTGEKLVPLTYHPIRVPLGVRQRRQAEFWLENFEAYFAYKYPDHRFVAEGLVELYAAALGQLWHLERAATLPASCAPSVEWPVAGAALGSLSNWTPAILKTLEITYERAKAGDKVLVGSDLVQTGLFVAEQLNKKGIRAVHITEEKSGSVGTKNPRKRAKEIREFAEGDAQVLCAGVQAVKLGHDLAVASAVVLNGLPYSFLIWDQFIKRVRRLTSKKPVNVYAIIPRRSLAETKWGILKDKGGASDLAFDGELFVQDEKPIDWAKELQGLIERGLSADGMEVPEEEVEQTWRGVPTLIGGRLPAVVPTTSARPSLLDLPDPSEYVQAALF
jgi:hypothetical protein